MNKVNNRIVGNLGENIACEYLEKLGYQIIERNYRYSKNAEIDIVAIDKDCLVFVEVKTRTNLNFGHPFESINRAKLHKIRTAAMDYMLTHDRLKTCRIDCIAIVGLDNPTIEHLKNLDDC